MSALAIIQSRLGSTRLPNKAVAEIAGKPLIAHVVQRVRLLKATKVVLAVPFHEVEMYRSLDLGVEVFSSIRQADDDVLGRFADTASAIQNEGLGPIIRVCGDCPMWDPWIGNSVLKLFFETPRADYASNVTDGYEDGTDVEVFTRYALFNAHHHAIDPSDREHVTPFVRRHAQMVTLRPDQKSTRKTSVDTEQDLENVRVWMRLNCE